ncbi:MAG: aldo/keto reductase [Bacteroidales bacterium]
MEYRKLPKTDIEISALAFGAWAIGGWMWGGADKKDAIKAIHTAMDEGITTIDTAPVYGMGKSETIVGEAIKGHRNDVKILTKFGLTWELKKGEFYFESTDNRGKPVDIYKYAAKDRVIKECEDSLKRLNTDYIDLLQIHWPDPTTPVEETMEAFQILLQQGKIRAAGVCNFHVDLLKEAMKNVELVSNQVPYSMVKRDIENDLVPYCLENNIGILAYSPLQRGVLTGKFKPGHEFNEGDSRTNAPEYKEPNLSRINNFLDQIKPVAEAHDATLAQLVLNWTLYRPGITCVLAGARNEMQVKDNVKALSFKLSGDEVETINDLLNNLVIERNKK